MLQREASLAKFTLGETGHTRELLYRDLKWEMSDKARRKAISAKTTVMLRLKEDCELISK